jgi:hypothetical protein
MYYSYNYYYYCDMYDPQIFSLIAFCHLPADAAEPLRARVQLQLTLKVHDTHKFDLEL